MGQDTAEELECESGKSAPAQVFSGALVFCGVRLEQGAHASPGIDMRLKCL